MCHHVPAWLPGPLEDSVLCCCGRFVVVWTYHYLLIYLLGSIRYKVLRSILPIVVIIQFDCCCFVRLTKLGTIRAKSSQYDFIVMISYQSV
jgi:hypothetical protein